MFHGHRAHGRHHGFHEAGGAHGRSGRGHRRRHGGIDSRGRDRGTPAEPGSSAALPVIDALARLKHALDQRLSRPGLDGDRLRAIAAVIDSAAVAAEHA